MCAIWQLVTPRVYRYEDEKWIDAFFETGHLRLSTFVKFATYDDEVRGDSAEATGVGYGDMPDGKSIVLFAKEGANSLILCCSQRLDYGLRRSFGRNSAFQIADTIGFATEVSRQLPGFRSGMEGSCLYRSDTMICRKIGLDIEKYKLSDGIDMQMMADSGAALGGPERLLLKHRKYEQQQEYRFIWKVDSRTGEYVDVFCPLARQYCRKVESADY